jgi:hypothetical protein
MHLPFVENINIDAIHRLFQETFGEPLFLNVKYTNLAVFSRVEGAPLTQQQQAWLAERYKPNTKMTDG